MQLRVELRGLKEVRNQMRDSLRQVRKATARGLTITAKDIRDTTRAEMLRVFRQPLKPYTLNAFGYSPALTGDTVLKAEVYLKRDPQYSTHPLSPQVLGGTRQKKRFERSLVAKGVMPSGWFAVPTKHATDGNLRVLPGLVQQVLGQAQTQLKASGHYGPVKVGDKRTARRVREARGRAGGQFVFVLRQQGKLTPGIYRAKGRDFGAKLGYGRSADALVKLFNYVPMVIYRPRLDFFGIAARIAEQRLARNIELSLAAQFF
ncbi:MAG: hypothetical protein YHS30scaffold667_43 [Phage 65_10]|nr:MAG: hypothetical protein YHS30scaffold667_43 [Phage 65_10]